MVLIILGQFYVKFGNCPVVWLSQNCKIQESIKMKTWTEMPFTYINNIQSGFSKVIELFYTIIQKFGVGKKNNKNNNNLINCYKRFVFQMILFWILK